MSDLIAVHGGLQAPVDRTVAAERTTDFLSEAKSLPSVNIANADLSSLYRFGDGALSPLTGPMGKEAWHRSLDQGVVRHDDRDYAWTIPISFPVSADRASTLSAGQTVQLQNSAGETVGTLRIDDVFPFEKDKFLECVYQTKRTDHPGGKMVMGDSREMLLGGEVEVLPQPKHPEYGQFVLRPSETRRLFAEKGWTRVVAFQTRNPLHRAHEYALLYGLEQLVGECDTAGAVLNPLIGETKSDDVDAATRMKTYQTLIDDGLLGEGDKNEALWESKSYSLGERVLLLGLDIKMFYAGPREAVMHGVYRQNFGFTDIVIGRKHADAPYDDGTDIWDGLDAQRIFDRLPGELQIKPVKVGFAAFYESLGRVDLMDNHPDEKPVFISGRKVREQLVSGEMPDPRIMRPETARILISKMHVG
ncbi:MAG: sulfate adenylyltransferase [Planctomycetota bacterium]|nr:sulfate adenylyltransferase [Planctomycetota bacterium]